MSPTRGTGGDGFDDENHPERRRPHGLGSDDPEGAPDVFAAPLSELKETLSDMTRSLNQLVEGEDQEAPAEPPAPVADLASVSTDAEPTADDDDASAASRVALGLGLDDDDAEDITSADTDEALESPSLLGMKVLEADLDGDLNNNTIDDDFEDDLPDDDDGDGGLEFAGLDFDGD